ncbi:neural cell adhesion molecule 2-like isoform X2 [Haemaphysalis longicornis]
MGFLSWTITVLLSSSHFVCSGVPGIKLRTMTTVNEDTQMVPRVTAVVGGAVHLPCNLSVPASNHDRDNVTLVLWSRSDVHGPLYSVDARNAPLERAKHFPSPDLGGRYDFNTSGQPTALLHIEPVRPEDAGEFRCRVDFRWARTHTFAVGLDVIVPPKKAIIMDASGKVLQDVIGPYDEGAPLTLACETRGGSPLPAVTWWRDMSLLDDDYYNKSDGTSRNELVIPRLDRSDARGVFTCQASNTNLTLPVYSSVTIDMNLRPLDVKVTSARDTLVAGHRAELRCQSWGAQPAARISWWKGGEKLTRTVEKVDGNVTSSTLVFVPAAEDHERLLTCKADNPQLPGSGIEDSVFLSVAYAPQLSLSVTSTHASGAIHEGSDVLLECAVRANPAVRDVWWKHNGRLLDRSRDAGLDLVFGNQSLRLLRVRRLRAGAYQCVASNTQGHGESNQLQLQIKFAPVCRNGQKVVYGVGRNEVAHVSCELEADPPDVSFEWRFNSTFDGGERHLSAMPENRGLRSIATHVPRTHTDFGALYCWGRNSVGTQLRPCVFNIVAAGPPEPLSNCNLVNATADSIRIECESGYNGGLEQTFHLEVIDSLRSETVAVREEKERPVFLVHPLPAGTEFIVRAFAKNARGRSDSDIFTASTEDAPGPAPGDSAAFAMSPLLGVMIGAIAALILVSIIIIIIIRMRVNDNDAETRELNTAEKSQTLLRKGIIVEDSNEGDIKDPDIIPPKSDLEDPEWVFRQLNRSNGRNCQDIPKGSMMYGTLPNPKVQIPPPFRDDMMYRERFNPGSDVDGSPSLENQRSTGGGTFRPQGGMPDPDEVDRMITSSSAPPAHTATLMRRSPQRREMMEREGRTLSTPV